MGVQKNNYGCALRYSMQQPPSITIKTLQKDVCIHLEVKLHTKAFPTSQVRSLGVISRCCVSASWCSFSCSAPLLTMVQIWVHARLLCGASGLERTLRTPTFWSLSAAEDMSACHINFSRSNVRIYTSKQRLKVCQMNICQS